MNILIRVHTHTHIYINALTYAHTYVHVYVRTHNDMYIHKHITISVQTPVVYPRTGPASELGSPLVWRSHTRGCGYARLAPLLNRRPEDAETPPWTETGSYSSFSGLLLNGRQKAARWRHAVEVPRSRPTYIGMRLRNPCTWLV